MKVKHLFLLIILLILVIIFKTIEIGDPDFLYFTLSAFVVIFSLIAFYFKSQYGSMKGYWIKPSYIFIISFLIVSFQRLIDYWIGYKSGFRFMSVVNHCLILELIGLVAFTIGYSSKTNSWGSKSVVGLTQTISSRTSPFLLFLQLFIFVLYLSSINIRQTLSGEAYSLGYTNKTSAYAELLFFSVNVSILYRKIQAGRYDLSFWSYIKSFHPLFLFVFFLYLLLKFVSGDRGPMVYNALLFLYGFTCCSSRKIKLIVVVVLLVLSASVMSILGITRQTKVGESSFAERFEESSSSYSEYGRYGEDAAPTIIPATEELAGSFNVTLAGVNAIIVDKYEYANGLYLLVNVLNTIPFFSSLSAPYISSLNVSSTSFANNYLGIIGYSVGTTLVSDLYLDLGLLWVILGFLLIGIFFKGIDSIICSGYSVGVAKSTTYKILIVTALCFGSCAISIPRSVFFVPVRYIVWSCIILFLDRSFTNYRRK